MDLEKLARLLVRRWLVSVPLLLLTGATAALTAFIVQPDYVARAYVSLLPPTGQRSATAGQPPPVNPWDKQTLTDAVLVRLNARSFAEQVGAEGYLGEWKAGRSSASGSMVRIEVTSPTAAQARSTAARLLREVDDEVARQQARYPDLAPADKITIVGFTSADEVAPATANVTRAVVVVAAAGLVLTTVVAAGVDALRARRARRRRPGTRRVSHRPTTQVRQPTRPDPVRVPQPRWAQTDPETTQPVTRITNVSFQMPATPGASNGASVPTPDDTTIALPMTNAPWAQRPRGGSAGGSEGDEVDKTAEVGNR